MYRLNNTQWCHTSLAPPWRLLPVGLARQNVRYQPVGCIAQPSGSVWHCGFQILCTFEPRCPTDSVDITTPVLLSSTCDNDWVVRTWTYMSLLHYVKCTFVNVDLAPFPIRCHPVGCTWAMSFSLTLQVSESLHIWNALSNWLCGHHNTCAIIPLSTSECFVTSIFQGHFDHGALTSWGGTCICMVHQYQQASASVFKVKEFYF